MTWTPGPVGIEGDPWTGSDAVCPSLVRSGDLGRGFLLRHLDESRREPDAVQVRIRVCQPVEQVQAPVHHVEGVVAALDKEPLRRDMQRAKTPFPARLCCPGQEALRVHPGIMPAPVEQQPEVIAQAEVGQPGVHQDRAHVGQGKAGECGHAESLDRPVEGPPPDPLIECGPLEPSDLPEDRPVHAAHEILGRDSGHGGRQASRPAEQEPFPVARRVGHLPVEPGQDFGNLVGVVGAKVHFGDERGAPQPWCP